MTRTSRTRPSQPAGRAGLGPARLRLVPPGARHGTGGKVIGRANTGRRVLAGISLPDARHHIHILGPTGVGKTTLMVNMILQDVAAGRGVAVFDPSAKGDFITDVLDRLPADVGDRLVIVDPDATALPALNLLDPATTPDGSPHQVAAQVVGVMARVWHRWWGHRTADIAHHGLLTLAHLPGATLADLPRLLTDRTWRTPRVARVLNDLGPQQSTLADFWQGFDMLPPGTRTAHTAPLMARLRLVLAHPMAMALFGTPAITFRLGEVLDGGILLVRLPKGIVGEDGCQLIGSLLLAGLWQATTARARIPEQQRLDAGVYLDECQNFLHLPIGISDALAEARGLRVSFALAHQYLGQLTGEMRDAVNANARNKVFFSLAPDDAADLAEHVRPWLDADDLTRLDGYEVVLRPIAGARPVPPCTLDTLPPPEVYRGRARLLRGAATRTGLSSAARARLAAHHTIQLPEVDDEPRSPGPPVAAGPAMAGVAYQATPAQVFHDDPADLEEFEDPPWTIP